MKLQPGPGYRYAFKRGMRGTDVAALQLQWPSLAADADGIFGLATEKAVKEFQRQASLVVDGIAGLVTQRAVVLRYTQVVERQQELPKGLLSSIAQNESGFAVAAYGPHPTGTGFDLGAFQRSLPMGANSSQADFRHAYRVQAMAAETGERMRRLRNSFADESAVTPSNAYATAFSESGDFSRNTFCWQLAVLSHNWPAAAEAISRIGRIFAEAGRDDREEDWIVQASGGRLRTPREWVIGYVERATALVSW